MTFPSFFSYLVLASALMVQTAEGQERTPGDEQRLQAVIQFADYALEKGRDRYQGVRGQPWWRGEEVTPLFVDGLEIETGLPVIWVQNGRHHVISNLAHQQNFFRTLDGLSNLTGDERYRKAAIDATNYMFDNYRSSCGLLYWGGHTFVDLRTLEVAHPEGPHMEIKMHMPYYDLMWESNPEATAEFIRAFWNSNLRDWGRLEINRHAPYGLERGPLWNSRWDDPEPLYQTIYHGSVMPITDMTYSAAWLSRRSEQDQGALLWSRRMAELFNDSRHPETRLGVARYTVLEQRMEWTGIETWTHYGDRTRNVFGPEFGDAALDAYTLFTPSIVRRIYLEHALSQLAIAEDLGEQGKDFLDWTVEGLKAYAQYAYNSSDNTFRPMLGDGTDLSGYEIKRGPMFGQTLQPFPAEPMFLLPYARAWRLSGEDELWNTLRGMFRGNDLGDMGDPGQKNSNLNMENDLADPLALLAIVELYRRSGDPAFLDIGRRVGDNMVRKKFRNNLFTASERHRFARFDAIEPLAILALEAAIRGEFDQVPAFIGGKWRYLQGEFDGHGRASDFRLYYAPDAYYLKRD